MAPVEPLDAEHLCLWCEVASLGFETTEELSDPAGIVGQDRAIAAIEFGVEIQRSGYNLFCLGPTGSGKHRIVRDFINQAAARRSAPEDWVYVNNFAEPYKPRALRLPTGRAVPFREAMSQLVDDLRVAIPSAFESEDYQSRRKMVEDEFKGRYQEEFEALQQEAESRSVTIVRTPHGFVFAPVKNGEALQQDAFKQLPAEEQERFKKDIEELQERLEALMRKMPGLEKEVREELRKLNRATTERAVDYLIQSVRDAFSDIAGVTGYLEEVKEDVVRNAFDFLRASAGLGAPGGEGAQQSLQQLVGGTNEFVGGDEPASFSRYQVNVVVHNGSSEGAPSVLEDLPTRASLIGRIEHTARFGALTTDFTLIKAGALHRANGGYLMLDARKLLMQPMAWEELKRALFNREIRIEPPSQFAGVMTTMTLEPEPIPLDIKIVLIGEPMLYYLLAAHDPDFPVLFKVQAEFDDRMDLSQESIMSYARLIAMLGRWESLPPLNADAVARVIEEGSRRVSDTRKLSTRFSFIQDLLREADYWATRDSSKIIGPDHVQKAIDAQIYRSDRIREAMHEQIERGTVLIDTDGERVGQVNGLAFLQVGDLPFGKPSRITARVRLGKGEVVDIERQVELGGPLHSKGVMILSGWLGARFARLVPLALSATLVFEQSYGGVDGDSASSTELYALLSALAEIPIRQQFAVTGSVNQFGEVQAIGGVNQKIEGFFDVCRERGLTGEQGVLVPAANVQHLMLRRDVVDACREGRFHVYPISTIEEGIELLTGVPAGEAGADGRYPEGTVYRAVQERLEEFAHAARRFARPGAGDGAPDDEDR